MRTDTRIIIEVSETIRQMSNKIDEIHNMLRESKNKTD